MGLVRPVPEAERFSLGPVAQECGEVRGVVIVVYSLARWRGLGLVIGGSRRVAAATADLPVTRPPPLAGVPDEVALLFEQVWVTREACGEAAGVRAGFGELPVLPAGQQRGAAG